MPERRRRNPSAPQWVFIGLLFCVALCVMIIVVLLTGKGVNSNPVTQNINRSVTKKAVEEYVSRELGDEIDIAGIQNSMTKEDSETVNEIINKYADSGVLSDAVAAMRENGGDVSATISELRDRIDEEDIETVKELYGKYKNQ